MKTPEHDDLSNFLAAWFHEDWDAEAARWEDVVDAYTSREVHDATRRSYDQLVRRLEATHGENEVDQILKSCGCAYSPAGHGESAREWIEAVAGRLATSLSRGSDREQE